MIDKANCLLMQILYNEKGIPSSVFSKSRKPMDYITGGIYLVHSQVIDRFLNSKKKYNFDLDFKKDIIKQLSTLEGIWN